MMKTLAVIFHCLMFTCSLAQNEIIRRPLINPIQTLLQTSIWADNEGYQVLDFLYPSQQHILTLIHEQHGEIGTWNKKIGFSKENVYGFTSNDQELTIYFRGHLNGKKDNYFITFFKDGKRQPIVTNWMNADIDGDIKSTYSFENKLYILTERKKEFQLIEVENYSKSRKISFSKPELAKVSHMPDWNAKVIHSPQKQASCKFSFIKLYPMKDSFLIVSDRPFLNGTFIIHANLTTGKVTSSVLPADPSIKTFNSMIVGNRLYRSGIEKKKFNLNIYEFPSLHLLKEFSYIEDQKIDIKVSKLVNIKGRVVEKDRRDESEDEKVVTKITKSVDPFFSVLQDSVTLLNMTFRTITASTMTSIPGQPGMSYSTGSKEQEYSFDVCFTNKFEPCERSSAEKLFTKMILTEDLEQDSESRLSSFTENRSGTFALHYLDREYYVLKYEKSR